MRLLVCSVVLVSALTCAGCGAAISSYLILSAQSEVDGAEAAEAEKYAPYHYTAAKEYLHKAREEQGYAEFQPAIEFAYRAKEHAELGRAKAEQMKKDNVPPPAPPAPPPTETDDDDDGDDDVDDEPRKAKPNIIIKKKPDAPTAPGATDSGPGPKTDAAPNAPVAPESKSPPAPSAPETDAPAAVPPEAPSPEASADDDDSAADDEAKKPRGPIIIPILPSTGTTGSGDS